MYSFALGRCCDSSEMRVDFSPVLEPPGAPLAQAASSQTGINAPISLAGREGDVSHFLLRTKSDQLQTAPGHLVQGPADGRPAPLLSHVLTKRGAPREGRRRPGLAAPTADLLPPSGPFRGDAGAGRATPGLSARSSGALPATPRARSERCPSPPPPRPRSSPRSPEGQPGQLSP